MKILALFGSRYGQAETVLLRIVSVLESHGHTVTVFKGDAVPRDLAIGDFEAVLIAASIIVGRYQPYIRAFVQRHAGELNARPAAFVSVNGTSPESAPEWREAARAYVQGFLSETGWTPQWTASFAGALRYTRYGFVTRWTMKRISRRSGGPTDTRRDYEFTDWKAVDVFARDLAESWALAPT